MNRQRFEALVGYTRTPHSILFAREFGWFSNEDERILGVLTVDIHDNDFGFVTLGRDANHKFRFIDGENSLSSPDYARQCLYISMKKYASTGESIFPQGDETRGRRSLFDPAVKEESRNPNYVHLIESIGYSPAKEIIAEMVHHYFDVDGNFAEQFQSSGFDARLWELYLFAYFNEERLFIDRSFTAPDYVVSWFNESPTCIEAVTVNLSKSGVLSVTHEPETSEEVRDLLDDFMPIKFGSALYSKLQKRYWELEHAKGKPLVIAIADFHDKNSMTWSSTALFEYLYGVRHKHHYNGEELVVETIPIEQHEYNGKIIPSGFFKLPESENISAVLFSASATISKFNRIGKLAGFGSSDVELLRIGDYHDHDPNASKPIRVSRPVTPESYSESWGEGLSMYHNPNAKLPVDENLFPSIAHHHFKDGQIVSAIPEVHPYSTITMNMVKKGK